MNKWGKLILALSTLASLLVASGAGEKIF